MIHKHRGGLNTLDEPACDGCGKGSGILHASAQSWGHPPGTVLDHPTPPGWMRRLEGRTIRLYCPVCKETR